MRYIDETHRYIDEEGSEYTPVTYFLKSFQEKVDWDKVAEKKAKKEGTTKEALLAQWAAKRDRAAEKGTLYHRMKEAELLKSQDFFIVGYDVQRTGEYSGEKIDASVVLESGFTYVEKMVWSNRYKICGTADLVTVHDDKIYVSDYKTNEKLETSSWKNPKTGKTRKLLHPLSHLDDCNFNLYQVQLNVYMYMLLQHNRNLKMGGMTILHVQFDDKGNPTYTTHYPVEDLQKEVRAMFEIFKTNKK